MSERRDRFMLDCGVDDAKPWNDGAAEILHANFVAFFRAGGVLSWTDWAHMAPKTCEIAEAAGRAVKGEQMQAMAKFVAAQLVGPSPAPVDAPDPTGERIRARLEQATAEASAAVAGGNP